MSFVATTRRSISTWAIRHGDRLLGACGIALLLVHCVVVTGFATNLLFSDGWTVLRPECLSDTIRWPWIWELHNEHRLIWTKLLHWLNLRYLNYSMVGQATANFAIYGLLVWLLLDWLKSQLRVPMGLMVVVMANATIYEIHFWGFQTHFHLYLLFFVLALRALGESSRRSWWGVFWAAAGIYAMAMGVFCAAACAMYSVAMAFMRPQFWRRHIAQAGLIAAAVVPWTIGFHKNPTHPDMAWPWSGPFWWHLGLTFVHAMGYRSPALYGLGIVFFFGFMVLCAKQAQFWRQWDAATRSTWLALTAYTGALLVSIGTTSMARAGLGGPTSRYYAPVLFLVPVAWAMVWQQCGPKRRYIAAWAGVALVLPLLPHYRYAKVYREAADIIDKHRPCIAAYYRGENDGICRGSYGPDGLPIILERAREMRLPFTQDMLLPFERMTPEAVAAAVHLDPSFCYVDSIGKTALLDDRAATITIDRSTECLRFNGWAWAPGRTAPQRDVAVELTDVDGNTFAILAQRTRRRDVGRQVWRGQMFLGVTVVLAVPPGLPDGTYTLAIRQGHGPSASTCPLAARLALVN